MASTNNTYLKSASDLFKGELSEHNEKLKEARDARNGTLWEVMVYLVCHAGSTVFGTDYTRAKAKRFKEDVMASFGISAKQAGKYTESISAALGVRGLRKGVQPMEGLMACAKTGPEEVKVFLNAKEITTFNQFMNATKTAKDSIQEMAARYHMLSPTQRERLQKLVDKLDKDEEGTEDEEA